MYNLFIKNRAGFSMMELIIYLAILSVVSLAIAQVFVSVNKGRAAVEAKTEVDSNLRFALEKITQDLRSAYSVTSPAVNSSSSVLTLVIGSDTVTYQTVNGLLKRQFNADTPLDVTSDKVVVNSVGSPMLFTRYSNTNTSGQISSSIEFYLNISYNSASPDWTYSAEKKTVVVLRTL